MVIDLGALDDAALTAASMGPRLDNRGYHRPPRNNHVVVEVASMGPRLDNRGYLSGTGLLVRSMSSFNGSTVG